MRAFCEIVSNKMKYWWYLDHGFKKFYIYLRGEIWNLNVKEGKYCCIFTSYLPEFRLKILTTLLFSWVALKSCNRNMNCPKMCFHTPIAAGDKLLILLLGFCDVWGMRVPTFRTNVLPQYSGDRFRFTRLLTCSSETPEHLPAARRGHPKEGH